MVQNTVQKEHIPHVGGIIDITPCLDGLGRLVSEGADRRSGEGDTEKLVRATYHLTCGHYIIHQQYREARVENVGYSSR